MGKGRPSGTSSDPGTADLGQENLSTAFDIWDLKGLLEEVTSIAWAQTTVVEPVPEATVGLDCLVAEQSFQVRTLDDGPASRGHRGRLTEGWGADGVVGWGGRVNPRALALPEWAGWVWGFELSLPEAPQVSSAFLAAPVSRYPASERDLALVVPDGVAHAEVAALIRSRAGDLLESLVLFDLYRGGSVGRRERSLAYRLRFRSPKRTLRDREVDHYLARVTRALKRNLSVEPRS